MATTASPEPEAEDQPSIAEFDSTSYGYLGCDQEGDHHHYDQTEQVIYVTTGGYDKFVPEGTAVYHYTIKGELVKTVDLTADELDDKGIRDWIDFVQDSRGWEHRPRSLVDVLSEALNKRTTRPL